MLTSFYSRNLPGLANVDWVFDNDLTVITGPIGSGKTLRMRDGLLHLLAGRIPSKRTVACFGKDVQLGATLQKGSASLSIMRNGSTTRILEEPTISGSGVKERVSMFTGIAASDLADLCYCSGIQLQQNMQLASSLMNTVRAAVGDSVERYSKVVSAEVSAVKVRLNAPRPPAEDCEAMKATLDRAIANEAAVKAEVEQCRDNEAVCRSVDAAITDKEQLFQINRLRQALGNLSRVPTEELSSMAAESHLYSFCKDLGSEYDSNMDTSKYPIDRAIPKLAGMLKRAGIVGVDTKSWSNIVGLRRELDKYNNAEVVTEEQKTQAKAYLDYYSAKLRDLSTAASDIAVAKRLYENAVRNRDSSLDHLAKMDADKALLAKLELMQSILLPSGKHSIEKRMLADMSFSLLAAATDYLCLCGMKAAMTYDSSVGIELRRHDGPVRAQELSEGESMIAALCLRLALAKTIAPVPFLVLDDITGSLGVRAEVVTDMLRLYAREQRMPVILNTQEIRVTGDRFYSL